MTDIDIERWRKAAEYTEESFYWSDDQEPHHRTVLALIERLSKQEEEVKMLTANLNLRLASDKKAIALWEEASGSKWPDHADLSVWLLGRMEKAEAQRDQLQDRLTCMCGDDIDRHPHGDGHSPVSMRDYYRAEGGEMEQKLATIEAQRDALQIRIRQLIAELRDEHYLWHLSPAKVADLLEVMLEGGE